MQTEALESQINWWKWGLSGAAGVLLLAYALYFGWHLGQKPALDAEKWGQFGDFFGGLLNPMVAFAAFYWLTQSVKLQKTELSETRKALEDSALSQREQVAQSERSTRIAALTAVLNALQQQINVLEAEVSIAEKEQVRDGLELTELKDKELRYTLSTTPAEMRELRIKVGKIESRMQQRFELLESNSPQIECLRNELNECLDNLRLILKEDSAKALPR